MAREDDDRSAGGVGESEKGRVRAPLIHKKKTALGRKGRKERIP